MLEKLIEKTDNLKTSLVELNKAICMVINRVEDFEDFIIEEYNKDNK